MRGDPAWARVSDRACGPTPWIVLASGAAVSKIADELNLSVKTVSTYRTRILEKMAMKSNADLTYYAIKNGLIE